MNLVTPGAITRRFLGFGSSKLNSLLLGSSRLGCSRDSLSVSWRRLLLAHATPFLFLLAFRLFLQTTLSCYVFGYRSKELSILLLPSYLLLLLASHLPLLASHLILLLLSSHRSGFPPPSRCPFYSYLDFLH